MKKKMAACLLAGAMLVGILTGCGSGQGETSKKNTSTGDTPLIVANDEMSEKFSPFYAESVPDMNIVDSTQIRLIGNDREGRFIYDGIEGHEAEYKGTNYTYHTPADLEITENEDGTVYYDFKLKEDLKFSDGEEVTADDVIFSYYVYCDPSYEGVFSVDALPIEGMKAYKNGMSTHISGIEKTGEKSVRITLTEKDATAVCHLNIYVAPLHYYGNESEYDYEKDRFGFVKGDLSSVREKTAVPMGAGPYRFVSYENKTVYMEANESYFKGEPLTKEVQWKTMEESEKLSGIIDGTVDISSPAISKEIAAQIERVNSNGEITGNKMTTQLFDYSGYGYIGICAQNVKVGIDPESEQSKNLRKAFATVFSVYREEAVKSYYGEAASVINYPISSTSWAAPQKSDPDYRTAFTKDADGKPIYRDGMKKEEKYAAALQAALGYFEMAGYTVEGGKVTAAPEGARMGYEALIPAEGKGNHPSYRIFAEASDALASIGMKLTINDLTDSAVLWDALSTQSADMWCATWQAAIDPDMFQIYHSEGKNSYEYGLSSAELDTLIIEARTNTDQGTRKAIYKKALDLVLDLAVEIPVYQRQEGTVFSTERVNTETIVKDPTTCYNWLNEIETLEMN